MGSPGRGTLDTVPVMRLLSVNTAKPLVADYTDAPSGTTGIDKSPADGPVSVCAPGPKGEGGSGLTGDTVADLRYHGGEHQAVYAFAREDLDHWERELGRSLPNGVFGENLTTSGVDVSGALIGERWRIGSEVELEVSFTRIPCRTFAGWLEERRWVKRFTQAGNPGAYFRVVTPGEIQAGDRVEVVHRPDHEVSVSFLFRALTTEPDLLPRVPAAGDALAPEAHERVLRRTARR
jgi:MOSC domain-containing protein YiiM